MRKKGKKGKTKGEKGKKKPPFKSVIKTFPVGLSSLLLAYHLTKRVSRLGFDWPNLSGVLEKLDEEVKEFREALSLHHRRRIREEMGDLIFVLVNIARVLRINPEEALKRTVKKFILRFRYIERSLYKKGKSLHQSNLIEKDQLWEEAKKKEKK